MTKGETLSLSVTKGNTAEVVFRFGGAELRRITAQKIGDVFTIMESTAAWTAGVYAWQAWATGTDGAVCVVAEGKIDLSDELSVGDARSVARRNVEMIESMLAKNAGGGVRRYKINNRELERYSLGELRNELVYWKKQVKEEERKAAGMSVLGPRIAIRF